MKYRMFVGCDLKMLSLVGGLFISESLNSRVGVVRKVR